MKMSATLNKKGDDKFGNKPLSVLSDPQNWNFRRECLKFG